MKRNIKVLLWGTGKIYYEHSNLLKLFVQKEKIFVVGITGNENYITAVDGYKFYNKKEIIDIEFDCCIICSANVKEITKEFIDMGFSEDRCFPVWVLKLPEFDLKKYLQLKESHISIIARNCWGGFAYNLLGMKFRTPFINMFLSDFDYIEMIKELKGTLENELVLSDWGYEERLHIRYPIVNIGNITLNMNHYTNFEYARDVFLERKKRINYDNLFFTMFTDNEKEAQKFNELKYQKKICFTSFDTDIPSTYRVPFTRYGTSIDYANEELVLGRRNFDLISLLLTGEIKQMEHYTYSK